jgi:enolase
MNIINGGKHADDSTDIQEYMIIPIGAQSFHQAVEMGSTVFHQLKQLLKSKGLATTVGDEGGFAPKIESNQLALELIQQAVERTGYAFGQDIVLGLDIAASELYRDDMYIFARESKTFSRDQLIQMYENWIATYPIHVIEDPLHEDDWEGYAELTKSVGDRIQIVGDDLYVTNVKRLEQGIAAKASNAILIKLNQIGTVTETIAAIDLARQHNMKAIVSHRSGETEDTTIADFVVGLSTGQIKAGSLSRTERVAKYNQLMRIEEALGSKSHYPGRSAFTA